MDEKMVKELAKKAGKKYVLKGKVNISLLGAAGMEYEVHGTDKDDVIHDFKDFADEIKKEFSKKSLL